MARINFRIRSKANKKVPIYIRFAIGKDDKDFTLNTGFSINPKDWSEKTFYPKQNNEDNKNLHSDLKKLETFIFDKLNFDLGKGILIDSFWLESKINDCFNRIQKTDTGIITNYIQEILDNVSTRKVKVKGGYKLGLSKSRTNSFIATQRILSEYQIKIKKQIHFIDLGENFIDKFTTWLLNEKKYAIGTASKHIANLKTLCNEAEKKGIQTNVFAKLINVFSESNEERFIQTLSFEELEIIRKAPIESQSLNNARKWLLLGCEFGQRGQDLLNVTKDDIRHKGGNLYLDIIQQKTKKAVTIGIIAPHVIDIIENGFPYKISTQKLNDYIKKVGKLAGLTAPTEGKIYDKEKQRKILGTYPKYQLLTTHSFRRSFCSNYYKKIPTPILTTISGHSKESLFLLYINKPEDKDSNADLFMKFYEDLQKDKTPVLKVVKSRSK